MMLPERLRVLWPPRSKTSTSRRIVVGFDGSIAGERALAWAVVRAVAGRTPLHIVHAVDMHDWLDPQTHTVCRDIEPREAGQRLLDDAVRWARDQVDGLSVTSELHSASPAAALLAEGRAAQLIVLGRSHWRRATSRWHPNVTARVARRARGRVVIVGPDNEILV